MAVSSIGRAPAMRKACNHLFHISLTRLPKHDIFTLVFLSVSNQKGRMNMDLRVELNLIKEQQHMTHQQIADGTGIPVGTVSSIFSGQTARPSFQDVVAILAFFGVSVDAFCGLAASPPDSSDSPAPHPSLCLMHEDVAEVCRCAIRDVMTSYVHRVQHGNLVWWRSIAMVEMLFIIGLLVWDVLHPGMGYIQYSSALMLGAEDMFAALWPLM